MSIFSSYLEADTIVLLQVEGRLNEVVHREAEVGFCLGNVGGEGVKTIPGEMSFRPYSVRSEVIDVRFLPVYEHITVPDPHKRTLHGRWHGKWRRLAVTRSNFYKIQVTDKVNTHL